MKYNSEYKSRFRILKKGQVALCISIATANILLASPAPTELPTNPNIVSGNINIQKNNANMVINQATNQGIINWGTFNIGANATVRFNQPNVNSSTLNRVVGGELSQIAGNLSANGNIILINPNGVIFQNGSRVDVGGITASTMNLSDNNYLNGNFHFTRDNSVGKVINQGTINAIDKGYVALLAPEILNEGVIIARKGTVAFASGDAVTLDFKGDGLLNIEIDSSTVNTLIENKALVQADGGYIYMSSKAATDAISSTISNTGTIQANSIEERDGKIILFAYDGTMNAGGKLEAKGGFIETSGTKVNISDNLIVKAKEMLIDPKNITITSSSNTALDSSGLGYGTNPSADSTITNTQVETILNGGTNLTLQANNDITVNSAISVANGSGDGGALTLASGRSIYLNANITTDNGNLNLYANDTLANGVNNSYRDSGTAVISMASGQSINAGSGVVTMELRNGAGKTYTQAGDITLYGITAGGLNIQNSVGNIAINGNIAKNSGTDNSAFFKAAGNIVMASSTSITSSSNKLNTVFWADSDVTSGGAIVLNGSNTISSNGGSVTLAGGADTNSDDIPDGYAIGNATYNNGILIQQGSNITSSGGNILIKGKSHTTGTAYGIYMDNQSSTNTISSGIGSITMDGVGQSTNGNSSGIRLGYEVTTGSTDYTGNLKIQSTTGAISISGTGATGGNGIVSGVDIRGSKVSIFSTSTGAITITGTGGTTSSSATTTTAAGIALFSGAILSNSGTITLNGTAGSGGDANKLAGIYVAGGSLGAATSYDITSSSSSITLNANTIIGTQGGSIIYMPGYNSSSLSGATETTATGAANGQTSGTWAITINNNSGTYGWGGNSDGTGWYTSDSGVLGAAIYSGVLPVGSTSGIVYLQSGAGLSSYTGGTRNGLTMSSYGSFSASYKVMAGSGGGAPKITTTGSVTIQPMGNTFSSTFDTGMFEYSGVSSLNIGKSTNTANISVTKDIAISGTTNNNAVVITGGSVAINKAINASAGNIVINANSLSMDSSYGRVQSSGKLTISPNSSATTIGIGGGTGTFSLPSTFFSTNFVNGFSEIIIGKTTQTGKITVGTVSLNDNLTLLNTIGGIDITGTVSMSSNNLTLNSSGLVADVGSGYISSSGGLLLLGGGSVILDYNSNNFTTLAANTGAITIIENNGFSIGTVGSTNGITSTGAINLLTLSGDIAITKNISTTNNTSSAVIINAGKNTNYGTSSGGNITVSNSSTITVGSGGRATLYTGSVSGSTGLTAMIGSGSGRFRYNSDEAYTGYDTTFAPLGTGSYAIYRERPTISASTSSPTITYGDALPSLPLTLSSGQNGDTVAQVFKTMPTLTISGSNNSDGFRNVGSYTISATGGAEGLGYNLSGISGTGTLTVVKKTLTVSGMELNDKIYNNSTSATTVANFGALSGFVGSDNSSKVYLNTSGYTVGTFSGSNVGTYSVSVSGLSLTGSSSGNYQLSSSSFTDTSVKITPATLTFATAINLNNKVYDGTTNATTVLSYPTLSGYASGDSSANVSVTGGNVASFSNKNAGNYSVSVSNLSLTGAKASNYILATTTSTDSTVAITKKTVSMIGASNVNKTYDGTTNITSGTYYSVSGLVSGDTLSTTGSGAYSSKDAGSRSVVQGTLALSGDSATNYSMNWSNGSGTIAKATLIMKANDAMKVITDTDPLFTAQYSGFVNGETSSVLSSTSFTRTAGEGAGNYTITPSGTASNYTIAPQTGSLTIQPADTLVIQLNNATSTYGNTPSSLTAVTTAKYYSSTLGQLKSFTLTNSGGTYSGSDGMGATISFTPTTLASSTSDVGNYDIGATVSLTGSQNYQTAQVQKGVLTINPLQVTLSAATVTKVYDGTTTVTSSNPVTITNLKNGDNVTVIGNGVYNSKDVLSATSYTYSNLALSGAKASNYAFSSAQITGGVSGNGTITPKSITVSATASDKVYDKTNSAEIVLSSIGVISGDTVTFSGTGTFANVNVGTQSVNVTGISKAGADNANYSLSSTSTSTTATISKKTITFVGSGNNKVYDGLTTATVNSLLSGVISGDSVNASYTSALFADKNVGANKTITVYGITIDNNNYTIAQTATTSADITPATLTFSAVSDTKIYDGTVSSSASSVVTGLVAGDSITNLKQVFFNKDAAGTNGSIIGIANDYSITDGNGGNNYTVVTQTATGTINKKALTMTLNDDAKIFNDIDPTLSARYSGFIGGEDESSIITNINRESGESAGTYMISATPTATNYDITVNNGTFTIVAADTLLIKLANIVATYGSTPIYAVDSAKYYSTTGSEIRTLSISGNSSYNFTADDGLGTTYTFDVGHTGTNVGNYIISASNGVQSGSNFNTPVVNNGVLTINPLAVTLASSSVTKVYDGTRTATGATITVSNKVGSDDITVVGTSLFTDKNVGTGKTYTSTNLALSGSSASNYYISLDDLNNGIIGTGDITAKTITLSGLTVADKTYDRTTDAVITSLGTLNDVVENDAVAINTSASAVFDTVSAGDNKSVTLSNVTLTGADAGNYIFASPTTTTANIAKKSLTLTSIDVNDRVYDGTDNASTISSYGALVGVIDGDTINATGGTVSGFSSKNVGTYAISVSGITLDDMTNYILSNTTLTDNTVSITPKTITLSGVSLNNKVYDATTMATTIAGYGTLSGIEAIDSGKVNAAGGNVANYSSKNAGNYTGINITGVALSGDEASNYVLAGSSFTADSTITQKSLIVKATANNKTYDGNTNAHINLSSTDIIDGDSVTILGNGTFDNANAANARRVDISGISLGTTGDEANYSLQNTTYTTYADINPIALTVSAVADTKVYDGTTSSSGNAIYSGTLVTGHTITLGQVFDSINAGSRVLIPTYTVDDGNNGLNYFVTAVNNTGTITPRAITLTADAKTKIYGNVNPALTYQIETQNGVRGLVNGDIFAGGLATTASQYSDVGAYGITSTLNNANYDIDYVGADLTIGKRLLNVYAQDAEKIVGLADPVFTYSVSGLVGVDTESVLSGLLSRQAGMAPGDYQILIGSLDSQNYEIAFNGANFKIKALPTVVNVTPPAPPPSPETPKDPLSSGNQGVPLPDGTPSGNGGNSLGSGTNNGKGDLSSSSTTLSSDVQNNSSDTSSQLSSLGGDSTIVSQNETKSLTFDGLTVGNTNTGADVKAIVVQGSNTSEIPVTMLVNVKSSSGFSFTIPQTIVSQSLQNQNIQNTVVEQVTKADGQPLPSWVSFNQDNMTFNAENVPDGGLPLSVKVMVSNGNMIKSIEVVIK